MLSLLFKKLMFSRERVFPVSSIPGLYAHDILMQKTERWLSRQVFNYNKGKCIFRVLWVKRLQQSPELWELVCWDCDGKKIDIFRGVEPILIEAVW